MRQPRYPWQINKTPLTQADAGDFASAADLASVTETADSAVQSIVAGSGVTVDSTDPQNPVVSVIGGSGGGSVRLTWRIKITARDTTENPSASYVTITEMEFRASAGGNNLCGFGTAFASSVFSSSYPASAAFDGIKTDTTSAGGCWVSEGSPSYPQYLGYALRAAAIVNEVAIWNRTQPNQSAPSDFTVQSSNDTTDGINGTWTDEWSVTGQTGWTAGEVRVFTRPSP